MKIVASNNINGLTIEEEAVGKPIIVNGIAIGYISGISGGNGFEDSTGTPLWVEVEIWDCGWSIVKDDEGDFVGINFTYPYTNIIAEEEDY